MKKWLWMIAAALFAHAAAAQQPVKIGVVASLSGGFAAAAKDTMDGFQAWEKAHGLPGRKIALEVLDDDEHVVHSLNHGVLLVSSAGSVAALYLVSAAGHSFST